MANKLGRNDPCHCGSGKKYKRCHLDADEQNARLSRAAPAPPPPPPPALPAAAGVSRPVAPDAPPAGPFASDDSPAMKRWDAFWSRFKGATLDEQFAMARDVIEREEAFDGEWAFDLMNDLAAPAARAGRTREYAALAALIAERHPAVYAEEGAFIASEVAVHALGRNGDDPTPAVRDALRAGAAESYVGDLLLGMLLFHGRDALLLELLREDPAVREHGAGGFGPALAGATIAAHVAAAPDTPLPSPELRAVLSLLEVDLDDPDVRTDIAAYAAREPPAIDAKSLGARAVRRRTVVALATHFERWLADAAGWPRARATLASLRIVDWVLDEMEQAKPRAPSGLFPGATSANRHFERLGDSPYVAFAFALAVPWWARYLVERGVVARDRAGAEIAELRRLWTGLPAEAAEHVDPELERLVASIWDAPWRPDGAAAGEA